ncbi:MAG: hypothetical protein NC311_10330 [Muribaculaceae bacterium]|nr:hypothetical protein [Muribaculaceae bacterium]
MYFTIRPMRYEERKYAYDQSSQLASQTGCIGHLRGDFGSSGNGFYTTWEDHNRELNTDEFSSAFDDVINALRSDEYGLLKDRRSMAECGRASKGSAMKGNYTTEYGFRVDTQGYACLIRCNPQQGDYNFYVYCYKAEWLDRHMERAAQDIRFIDSNYNDLFSLPDGEQITITHADGAKSDYTCRFIDEAHVEVGYNLYHICEFAEKMERSGASYAPKETPLPKRCFSTLPSNGEVIILTRYVDGYVPLQRKLDTPEEKAAYVERGNKNLKVTKAQEAAMLAGSMFGWDTPAAKPKNYDENGKAKKPKDRER